MIVAILSVLGMETILHLIGASVNTIGFARQYLAIIAIGAPFIMFSTAFANILRGEGASRESMVGNLIGTVVNIILDPIMILVLGWGVTGAALATIIGNIAACLYYIAYYLRGKSTLSIHFRDFKMGDGIASGVAGIGIPASLNNILMSFANIILNQALVGYGDTPVAAMGVAMKSNMLVVLLQIGLCVGIQPLIGYNYGARNKKRLMSVFKFTGLVSVIMGTILTLIMIVARKTMIQMFINDFCGSCPVWYSDGGCPAAFCATPWYLIPLHQYDPGNGKSASVADSYDLPPGTDFYSADFRAECDVWPGWSYLCTAGG